MATYKQFTFSTLKTQAANRLGNSSFWSATELGLYLNEAIKMWNLITHKWRNRVLTLSIADTVFYTFPTSVVKATTTDQNILNEIQYHCLETPNNGASLTNDLWTISEIIDLLNNKYNKFVGYSKLKVTQGSATTTPYLSRYDLFTNFSTELADITRAAWIDIDGYSYRLQREDEFTMDNLYNTWPGDYKTPVGYRMLDSGTIELVPAPISIGSLSLCYTKYGTALSNSGVTLIIPDDFSQFVKWGTLCDMFTKEGQAHDMLRAEYCNRRFVEGLAIADYWTKHRPLRVEWNENPMTRASLTEMDNVFAQWEGESGTPNTWAPFGAFEYAIYPYDADGNNQIAIDGLVNAPTLTNDTDYIDLSKRELNALLDYVEHIALFKVGGQEFIDSMKLYERFMQQAMERRGIYLLRDDLRRWMGSDFDTYYEPLVSGYEEPVAE